MLDGFGNLRINISQTQLQRREAKIQFVDAAFVASSFKFSSDECVENFFRQFGRGVSGEAQDIHVVVAAHQVRLFFVEGLARARAGNFVGGDVNSNAAGAAKQSEFRASIGDSLRDRLREIGIIVCRVFCLRAEIFDAQSARLQIFFQRFLQIKAAVVRADGEIDDGCGFRAVRRGEDFVLFHKFQ